MLNAIYLGYLIDILLFVLEKRAAGLTHPLSWLRSISDMMDFACRSY